MKPERVRVQTAACILGVEHRTVQALAQRGDLPGAVKVGRVWTFNEAALRAWLVEEEACRNEERRRNGASGEVKSSGVDIPLTASRSARAFEQARSKLLQSVRIRKERRLSGAYSSGNTSTHGRT